MMRLHSLTFRTSLLVIFAFVAPHAFALTASAQTTQPTGATPATFPTTTPATQPATQGVAAAGQ